MACILVFIEQRNGSIRKASLEALSEARRLASGAGWSVCAVVAGHGVAAKAAELGAWGAGRAYVAEEERFARYSSEGYAAVVRAAAEKCAPVAVFMAATALGRDLSGRVAARLGWGCFADVTKLAVDGGTVKAIRPVYSGKALASVDGAGKPVVVTLRPNVFPAESAGGAAEVEPLPVVPAEIRAVVKEILAKEGGELDVAEADVIVTGGRGIKGPENFALIRDLAKVLGAAVGASRAVVDAGWIEHSHQVGQTGKVVSPSLYIACGVSGAIQHLAGMSSSKVIVAINKDPEAPIFKVADYGIVGDLFQVVPALTEEVRKLKAEA
ncbi:MAG TPA: electron transfer flavoprotein subunit alpha/FixB family protein [Thermoanaerobaculaceae bacterium]|nr:electron transfer flavoprotein subunit alpha/FixB family protein [Thermoanaerobaculaceae bacterium]